MVTFIARFYIVFDATLMLASFAADIKSNPVKTADTAVTDPGEGPAGPPPLIFRFQGRGDRPPPLISTSGFGTTPRGP